MSQTAPGSDPLEFLKSMWNGMGFSLPGMMTPTLDVNELEKRIADMRAVEHWLKVNLGMLQTSIQGLEMQRATLSAVQALSQSSARGASGGPAEAAALPFASPAMWPWNMMQQAAAGMQTAATNAVQAASNAVQQAAGAPGTAAAAAAAQKPADAQAGAAAKTGQKPAK
ncbi:MAG: hypothetical protein KF778_05580 [Rhodocyclaceae bacterium]|nr:hypothetical protein [Rhodocyclaceae bacterium]MBX3667854.1 hypothetical protein [Rhodocyclaceae bacterium]